MMRGVDDTSHILGTLNIYLHGELLIRWNFLFFAGRLILFIDFVNGISFQEHVHRISNVNFS